MHTKRPLDCFAVDVGRLKWDYSQNPPKLIHEIPQRHVSAWDLRTKIRNVDNQSPTNSGNFGSSLAGEELEAQRQTQSQQSNSLKTCALADRKSESAESIPRKVQCWEINGNDSSISSVPSFFRSIHEQSLARMRSHPPPRIPAHFRSIRYGVPKREEAPLHSMLGNLRLSDAPSRISKKWKKQQKLCRNPSLADRIISEIVPGIAKMKCHDTGEEYTSPGHI